MRLVWRDQTNTAQSTPRLELGVGVKHLFPSVTENEMKTKTQTLWRSMIIMASCPLRIEYKILTITYKALHGLAPTYIKDLLKNYHPSRDLRSSKKNLLVVPAFNTNSYGRRAFSIVVPLLWNSLSQHIRDARSLDIFKRRLKTALFIRAF